MASTTTPGSTRTAASRRAAGQKAAATRKRNATKRSATTAKADAKRTLTDTQTVAHDAGEATAAEAKVRITQVRELAELTVDVPVGVGLVARDNLVSTVRGLARLGDRTAMERELRRYERRGASARNRFEREVRRTGATLERGARRRRDRVTELVTEAQNRITTLAQ